MPLPFRPNCLPSALSPLPHQRVTQVWDVALPRLQQLAPFPLLVHEGEGLAALAIDGLSGALIADDQINWDTAGLHAGLDQLYAAYLKRQASSRGLTLIGLSELKAREGLLRNVQALSVVQFGPISLGFLLVNECYETAIGDPVVFDALIKHLSLRLEWHAEMLKPWRKPLVQWLYEPYLDLIDSPFAPVGWDEVRIALAETFGRGLGVRAVWTGPHTNLDQLLQDETIEALGIALPPPEQATVWAEPLRRLLRRKGVIGWGMVPTTSDGLRLATAGRLAARFEHVLHALNAAQLTTAAIVEASLIMPEDTLANLSPSEAERALNLTVELASLLRQAYGLE